MRLYADSACDLPKAFFEENNVTLIPMRVHMDESEYEDVASIEAKKVYDFIRNGGQPKTSQASPEIFLELFEELAKSGEEGIYIAFSSALSGTCSTAVMIREQVLEQYPDLKLTIIDTKCASLGFGLVVQEAVSCRAAGLSFSEMEQHISHTAKHMEHLFTVEDLDYMARGGRVSKASAFIGGLLSIKPLLNVEDGKLVPIEKHRGRKKVMKRILELMEERGMNLHEQTIGISHGDDLQLAEDMKMMIQEKFQPKAIEIQMIGSAIAAHAGPGTLAVFFLNNTNKH